MKLEGRSAIVTGGSRGIGRAIATVLAREGARLALIGRDAQALTDVRETLSAYSGEVLVFPGDVSSAEDVNRLIEATLDRYGEIDILVNNAGINPHRNRPVLDTTEEDWERVMAVNLRGCFLCTRAVLPAMKRKGRGWIVNISSIGGRRIPDGLDCAYRASKFGLRGFTLSVAQDCRGGNIAVSAVFPGTTGTDMVAGPGSEPSGRLDPMDVAEVVLFLVTRDPAVVIPEIVVAPRTEVGGQWCPYRE